MMDGQEQIFSVIIDTEFEFQKYKGTFSTTLPLRTETQHDGYVHANNHGSNMSSNARR